MQVSRTVGTKCMPKARMRLQLGPTLVLALGFAPVPVLGEFSSYVTVRQRVLTRE